jgi:hypothetical protein
MYLTLLTLIIHSVLTHTPVPQYSMDDTGESIPAEHNGPNSDTDILSMVMGNEERKSKGDLGRIDEEKSDDTIPEGEGLRTQSNTAPEGGAAKNPGGGSRASSQEGQSATRSDLPKVHAAPIDGSLGRVRTLDGGVLIDSGKVSRKDALVGDERDDSGRHLGRMTLTGAAEGGRRGLDPWSQRSPGGGGGGGAYI